MNIHLQKNEVFTQKNSLKQNSLHMSEIVIPLHLETIMFKSDNIVQVCNQTLPFEVSESDHSPQMKLRKAVYRSLPLVNNIARL